MRIPAYERFHTPSIREPMELPVPAAGSCLSRASCSGRAAVVVSCEERSCCITDRWRRGSPRDISPALPVGCILQERASVARLKKCFKRRDATNFSRFSYQDPHLSAEHANSEEFSIPAFRLLVKLHKALLGWRPIRAIIAGLQPFAHLVCFFSLQFVQELSMYEA